VKRLLVLAAALGAVAGPLVAGFAPARAVDHGQVGTTWPVIEPDLLRVIQRKLEAAEANGDLDALNARFAERVKERVMRPVPVAGIRPAAETRVWEFDPAIIIEQDIRDHEGRLIAPAGQRVNPLDTVSLTRRLIFIDGDSQAELAWAMAQGSDRQIKIIMTRGSPFAAMKAEQRRFYFDQGGTLTAHFGISHTPASVEQRDQLLLVSEIAIDRKGEG